MRKDDSITFDAAAEAAAGAGEAFYYKEEGNVAHYSGPLGTFTFDRTQFELRKHPVPASGDGPAADTTILKYIGTETDGRKISIPKGCTDISMTFAGTGIASAPRIPFGVKYAVGTFKDCDALADARGNVPRLPLTVSDSSYMFAGCTRLRSGPDVPGTVDAMDGMYYGCHALSRTPSIGGGVGTMDYAFADCPSLKQAPRVPKAAISARDVTACCPGIDAAKDRERSKERLAGRDRYERKLDRKSLAGMIGSAFAACLQCHALRKLAGAEFELRQNFVAIGTAAVDGKTNAYVNKDGKLVLPAAEYVIPETGKDAVATIALVDITPENSTSGKVYRVAKPDETGTTNKIVTDATGKITVQGLDSMLYAIKEIKAPTGYNLLEKPVMMAVGSVLSGNGGSVFTEDTTAKRADENADYTFTKLADTTVGIANASGVQLPRTGGIGTTIFYVLGGTMMVLAAGAGVIVMKKRYHGQTRVNTARMILLIVAMIGICIKTSHSLRTTSRGSLTGCAPSKNSRTMRLKFISVQPSRSSMIPRYSPD